MPVHVHVTREGPGFKLRIPDRLVPDTLLHVLFIDGDDCVIQQAQLKLFAEHHTHASHTTPQLCLIVLKNNSDQTFWQLWASKIREQLVCSNLMLTQCLSQAEYDNWGKPQLDVLEAKFMQLKSSAIALSAGLQQKELIWAQTNASKKITKGKELVNEHLQNPTVGSMYFVAGDMWQPNDSILMPLKVSVTDKAVKVPNFPKFPELFALEQNASYIFDPDAQHKIDFYTADEILGANRAWDSRTFYAILLEKAESHKGVAIREQLTAKALHFDILLYDSKQNAAHMQAVASCGLRNARQHWLSSDAHLFEQVEVTSQQVDQTITKSLKSILAVKTTRAAGV